jgi:hypothetical protein
MAKQDLAAKETASRVGSPMQLAEAKAYLTNCVREELRDHAFGDAEISWFDGEGKFVADGYFGNSGSHVTLLDKGATFVGDDAQALRGVGKLRSVQRNDMTGDDVYRGA